MSGLSATGRDRNTSRPPTPRSRRPPSTASPSPGNCAHLGAQLHQHVQLAVSIDYNISDKDQLRGRYVDNKISSINIAANLPVFFFPRPTTSHLGSISEFHNFRPNLTNELRLAFNH
jgi:hypothetical protein